ncbi:MAG: hypothetical protein B6242_03500 [Anaerolineaceae bacterium 4572_78]|nr:MAG: hypothetical protein B6242_03500 [Anaerolineaceae bacterium 4572_78]
MDPQALSTDQILKIIRFLVFGAVISGAVFIYSLVGFRGAKKKKGRPLWLMSKQSIPMENSESKKKKGLLKSLGRLNKQTESDSHQPQVLLTVLLDRNTHEIIIDVDGTQYRNIKQINDKSVGQRILEVTASLLKFTQGLIMTTDGAKSLPIPDVKLTALPKFAPVSVDKETMNPEIGASKPGASKLALTVVERISDLIDFEHAFPTHISHVPDKNQSEPVSKKIQPKIEASLIGRKEQKPIKSDSYSFNLAEQINQIVQRKLKEIEDKSYVKIDMNLDDTILIIVNERSFRAIDDVQPPKIRKLIQDAIHEWNSGNF